MSAPHPPASAREPSPTPPEAVPRAHRLRPLILPLLVLALVAAWLFGPLAGRAQLTLLIEWMRGAGASGMVAFVALHAAGILFFVPVTPFNFVAGFIWGPLVGTAVMSVGSLIGTTSALLLGRWLLRGPVSARYGQTPLFRAVDRAVAVAGYRAVFLLRSAPIPLAVLNYALSLTRIPVLGYALASVLGLLPLTVLYTSAGAGLAEVGAILEGRVALGEEASWLLWCGLLAMAAVGLWLARLTRRNLRALQAQGAGPL